MAWIGDLDTSRGSLDLSVLLLPRGWVLFVVDPLSVSAVPMTVSVEQLLLLAQRDAMSAVLTVPDEVRTHAPTDCRGSGADLTDAPVVGTQVRQVFDLPVIELIPIERIRDERLRDERGALSQYARESWCGAGFDPDAFADVR